MLNLYYAIYGYIQAVHYSLAETNVYYRVVSLSVFAVFAPIIVLAIWTPTILDNVVRFIGAYVCELIGFYTYLPAGFRGKRREV